MNDTTELLPLIKLRFNIEHPNFEDCYAFGYECALAEMNEEENPFRSGTRENEQWSDGWWAGFYGEEPLFEVAESIEEQTKTTQPDAANDRVYHGMKASLYSKARLCSKLIEISGMLAVSATIGYQVLDLVA